MVRRAAGLLHSDLSAPFSRSVLSALIFDLNFHGNDISFVAVMGAEKAHDPRN
jgi:hypothetical protein